MKNLQNKSVHDLKYVCSEEAYKAPIDTIEIIEHIFFGEH